MSGKKSNDAHKICVEILSDGGLGMSGNSYVAAMIARNHPILYAKYALIWKKSRNKAKCGEGEQ